MKHPYILEVILQIGPFIGTQNSQGQAYQRPEVDHAVMAFVVFRQIVDLRMAIVAPGDTVIRPGFFYLPVFKPPVMPPFLIVTRL